MNQEKNHLRSELLGLRKALSQSFVQDHSQQICQKILNLPLFQKSQQIAYYLSCNNEVCLNNLVPLPHQTFYLPKLLDNQSMFFCQDIEPYLNNRYGIPEPQQKESIQIEKLDIILLPLVGFDQKGHRLGMGKAFYDRALSNLSQKPKLIGVAYAFQERKDIPFEAHDKLLDMVITENDIFYCQ
jgi:5-formyltetrahydrofolate cyclo-ligase